MFVFIMIINFLVLFFMVFMSVAFFTLLERKVLGYIQLRKGPNKFFIKGIFQPMGDGLKLFFKEVNYPSNMNFFYFYNFSCISFINFCIFLIYLSLYWYKLYYGFWFNLYILLFKFNSLYFFDN